MVPQKTSQAHRDRRSGDDRASARHSLKRRSVGDDDEISQQRPAKRFQHLKPRTKRISQQLITAKWIALPADAQQQIRELLKSAKRPIVLSRRDERQRREAEGVLEHMVRRLEKQLPRMPFPPKSKEMHFDLDKLLERNRVLEGQVTPAIHGIELLKAEIQREEAALDMDQSALRSLEKNARAERRENEKQMKKIHPLLEDGGEQGTEDEAELINLQVPQRRVSALEDDLDAPLQPLLIQFKSHLESIRANTEQLDGLGHAVVSAEAALHRAIPLAA